MKAIHLGCSPIVGMGLVLILTGCATQELPEYHSDAPASSARTFRQSGVEVALDPFVERQRTQQFFGIHAAEEGIGIVFVHIANNTPDQTFLVEKGNCQLLLAGAAAAENANTSKIERGTAGGEATALVGAAVSGVGGLALMIGGSSMIAHSMEVQRNFIGKEMPDQTLAPGKTMEGFIYFKPVPKTAGWVHGATIKIDLTETRSHEHVSVTAPLP